MSMRLIKQLVNVGAFLLLGLTVVSFFSYDIIKLDWVVFMELQPSFSPQEKPLPVPPLSVPVEGPAYINGGGAPTNPIPADDETSIARGKQLYDINCQPCHGATGKGDGPIAQFLVERKPVDLTGGVQVKGTSAFFMAMSKGFGLMPAYNENLTVRERWDVANYVRTLKAAK